MNIRSLLFVLVLMTSILSPFWGIPGFYARGTTLYVRLAGDANPNTTTMIVSRYVSAFEVD